MKNIKIKPWVGELYKEGFGGLKLLIVGESNYDRNYSADNDYSEILIDNVQKCVFKENVKFFTMVANLASQAIDDSLTKKEIWNRIAFHNYIQAVLDGPKVRPDVTMWEEAQEAFQAVLHSIFPDFVIVLGKELGSYIYLPDIEHCIINHPSSGGFSYSDWVPVIKDAISSCRTSPE